MAFELSSVQTWKTFFGFPTTTEAGSSRSLAPSAGLNVAARKAVAVHPYTAVAFRMFGKNTAGDTATIRIRGYMTPAPSDGTGSKSGTGPPQELWYGQIALGSLSLAAIPFEDGRWGASATWFEVDTYDISGIATGHNAAKAIVLAGGGAPC